MSDPVLNTPDVTIVGAGIAGMAAALKLVQAGFSVRVLEAGPGLGGKFGAVSAKGGRHDFAWHVFADWYPNFWDLARAIGLDRQTDFAARPTLTLLRPLDTTSTWPRAVTIASIASPETFWSTANSGIAHWSDVMLFAFSQAALLCDTDLEREEFLNRVTVNGYMRSLPYMSDVAALLHNELLLRIWAIPSYLISARSYRTHLALIAPFRTADSPLLIMRKNFEDGFWAPFLTTLSRHPRFSLVRQARLTGIRLAASGDRVEAITVRYGSEPAARVEKVNSLIVAIPPDRLTEVLSAPESLALRQAVPGLLGIAKLDSQHTAALTLCLNRKPEAPRFGGEPVVLVDDLETVYAVDDLAPRNGLGSDYGLSFIDVAGLRQGDHPSVLTVLASDADTLVHLDDEEACRRIIAELRTYVRFDERDIDWNASHYQAHATAPLFVNSVGSWEYRPEVRLTNGQHRPLDGQIWRTVRNLYLAGDYCRSEIDIVSLEGAIHTGIWAAHALAKAHRAAGLAGIGDVPEPVRPVPFDLERARRTLAILRPWTDIAAKRSRLVKQELIAAAAARSAAPRQRLPGPPASPPHSGGGTMSTLFSTYPTFASPSHTGRDWTWLGDRMTMTRPVTLKSGAVVSVPLLFWDTQAVCIHGLADAESVDLLLRDHGLRARHVDPANATVEKPGSGYARVRIWAPHYAGSSVGPLRSVHALIHVQPRRECRKDEKDERPDHWWWWWYYGDSAVNDEFKRDVWGVPAERAPIELSYQAPTKVVRLLENGATALRITCTVPPAPAAPAVTPPSAPSSVSKPDFRFRTVARRSHDDGENWANVKLGGPAHTADVKDETLYVRRDSAVDRHLRGVGFKPQKWTFFEEYHGIVELWDDKGSGRDPVRDTEDKYEVVRHGDAWVIREFESPRPSP